MAVMVETAADLLPGEMERAKAARTFVHATTCPNSKHTEGCAACPGARGLINALRVLEENPRDARGARRALHDAACMSGCGPESDHADRTQSRPAAALRKFLAQEVQVMPVSD